MRSRNITNGFSRNEVGVHLISGALALLLLFIVSGDLSAQTTSPSTEIEWIDASDALEGGLQENRIVLLDFYTDWCGWCKRMDRETFADSAVGSIVNEFFLAAKINPEKDPAISFDGEVIPARELAAAMQVTGYPTIVLLVPEEGAYSAIPLSGYRGPQDFSHLLRYFSSEAYLTKSFEEFTAGSAGE